MTTKIYNPILPGFNPDPSILCVGEDYYIATSTFEWFPGVQIHHSKDLLNWEVVARPLATQEHLNMLGNPFSGGVWAPCLSYSDDKYYLIFTDVKSWRDYPFKDTHNYITTADKITGPWSKPIYLNSSGFDPSLFHDDDGKKWLVNMEWDYRKTGGAQFSGILLQEYDADAQHLVGAVHKICKGTHISITEGPHIYKKDGYYYLLMAEGGTSYQHAATVARSKQIIGPYELHPGNPILTAWEGEWPYSAEDEKLDKYIGKSYIKKAGHASWCLGANGKWYLVHLGGRPVGNSNRCVLGRETSIQELVWKEDGWCYLKHGNNKPAAYIEVEADISKKAEATKVYHFNNEDFLIDFQTLRTSYDEQYMSIHKRQGYLRMIGRESIYSTFRQTLLARRQTDFKFEAEVVMEFTPTSFQHTAGLIYRYNESNQYYLFMSYDEEVCRYTLNGVQVNNSEYTVMKSEFIDENRVWLKVIVSQEEGRFCYKLEENEAYKPIGDVFDTTILSDEYAVPMGFTGAFVGICVQDLQGQKAYADFERFVYKAN